MSKGAERGEDWGGGEKDKKEVERKIFENKSDNKSNIIFDR